MNIQRNPTRSVRVGRSRSVSQHPIAVQSMTATHTRNIDATVEQVNALAAAGADVVRIAVDSDQDAQALAEIRKQTTANLSVDLQENYRLASKVAPTRQQNSLQTPATCTITRSTNPGRRRYSFWWRSPASMIVPSASGSTAAASIPTRRASTTRTTRSHP